MCNNIENAVREPLLSQIKEIAEEQNMELDEFVEYVLRRYVDDIYGLEPLNNDETDDEACTEDCDAGVGVCGRSCCRLRAACGARTGC